MECGRAGGGGVNTAPALVTGVVRINQTCPVLRINQTLLTTLAYHLPYHSEINQYILTSRSLTGKCSALGSRREKEGVCREGSHTIIDSDRTSRRRSWGRIGARPTLGMIGGGRVRQFERRAANTHLLLELAKNKQQQSTLRWFGRANGGSLVQQR